VTHIDPATIDALTDAYRELVPDGARVLDLMSSWVSHLPSEARYAHVAGLGLNAFELAANPRLCERRVHDLNADPKLPWPDASFDAVLCAVSVQYLVRPVDVFAEIGRVLAPGGVFVIATSHRLFPTKAIAGWQALAPTDRMRLLAHYLALAGAFDEPRLLDRSPPAADPLWIVHAHRGPDGGPSRSA
jgi:SAM-dependent methyltransferase